MKVSALGAFVVALVLLAPPADAATRWVGIWGASPSKVASPETLANMTIRQSVHLDGSGGTVRLRLSNALSNSPLLIGGVTIARPSAAPGTIEPSSNGAVTFGGRDGIFVPAYAAVLSDPIGIDAKSGTDVVVSLYVAASKGPTLHEDGQSTAFVASGDETRLPELANPTTRTSRIILSGIDAEVGSAKGGTIVALGDSITDGFHSTPDLNRRWPDALARRIASTPGLDGLGVVDAGISGNRLLRDKVGPSGLSRLPRDVIALPNLRMICVLEGINDIAAGADSADPAQRVTAADLIAGYEQIIAQGHEAGARILIGTLTPFSGTGHREEVRQRVNAWIRQKQGFDGVLDFDAALRDPKRWTQLLARYDSGDHIHPNDEGYTAMADAVDLDLFR